MKKSILFGVIYFLLNSILAYGQTISISQVDTFAIKGLPAQPVLKVNINTGVLNYLALEKLVINYTGDDSLDIDYVSIYSTSAINRFSLADYPGEANLITSKKKLVKDSVVFSGLTFPLEAGDNFIWIVFDLAKNSIAGHNLDASIRMGGITVSGSTFPASLQAPTGQVMIRQKYFTENFEKYDPNNRKPLKWTIEGNDTSFWQCQVGGYSGNPSNPKSGNLNARMYSQNAHGRISTMYYSNPINLSLASKPLLTFYHAQMYRNITNKSDSLGIYYKIGINGAWKFIKNYLLPTPDNIWVKREITLPDEVVNSQTYIGFKGIGQFGFGVCIDSINIYESTVSTRLVNSIHTDHPSVAIVPQSSTNNPILRTNVGVRGNTGTLNISSIKFTSLNTNDGDILANGVKLYYTTDSSFFSPVLVASGTFSSGTVIFNGFSRKLETGDNYFWLTYDISNTAIPGDFTDAKIQVGDIVISDGGTYPATEQSPGGHREIKQSIFFDDFESDKGWQFTGDFERGIPAGKGGGGISFADPAKAYSQSDVIGDDIGTSTNNGNYEANTTNTATSPLIHAKYYKNTLFNFAQWLNVENLDSAFIEYQYENESKWYRLWQTTNTIIEGAWSIQNYNTKPQFDRKNFKIRYRLGPTNDIIQYSGWNVDYLFISGDSVKFDAAVTKYLAPQSACGLTTAEHFKVRVKNTGPQILVNIPMKVSTDAGKTWITETIPGPLAVDDSLDFTFSTAIDMTKPSIYNVIIKAALPQDNFSDNDSITYQLYSVPTYSLPYRNGFEKDTTFWTPGGFQSSWFQGKGGILFQDPYEGQKYWKTNTSGHHNQNENSYIESPCYNFSNVDAPLIDMYYNYSTAPKMDGARMQYSIDGGSTWTYMPEDTYNFPWSWYNDTIHTYHDQLKGWTERTIDALNAQTWVNGKQVLPAATAHQPMVRFRIQYKSDPSVIIPYDGFAFDDVKLLNAPYDLGVKSIDNLNAIACQNANPDILDLTVKNFGIRDVLANDSIIIGVKVNNSPVVIDTFKISTALAKNDERQFTMKKHINIAAAGNYLIKAFVIEKFPHYYETKGGDLTNNDTTNFTLDVYPNPITSIPDTVFTARMDTLIISTVENSDYHYSWVFNNTEVSTLYQLDGNLAGFGKNYLTVTNSISGCVTKDSVFIKRLIPDVGINKIVSPISGCGYGNNMHPVVQLKNFGTDTLRANQIIPVKLKLNNQTEINDQIKLTKKLAPDSVIEETLSASLILTTAKTDTLAIYTALLNDNSDLNDSTKIIFQIYGYPHVFLGNDTVIKGKLSYILDAGAAYSSYKWSDGITTTETFSVTKPGKYAVTVTDSHNCPATDTINVHMIIHDLAMQKLVSPLNSCTLTSNTGIQCQIKNAGTDTIQNTEPIILMYEVNSGGLSKDTIQLVSMLKPGDSIQYTFKTKVDMSAIGLYSFKLKSLIADDIQPLNDSLVTNISVYGNPTVNLGNDKIVQALNYNISPGKFAQYKWQDNSADSTWVITKDHFDPTRTYSVTVTDNHGCIDRDTVSIFLLVNDLELSGLLFPENSCSMSSTEYVNVKVKNSGNAALTNKSVNISYALNGHAPVNESFNFTGAVGVSMIYTFTLPIDLSQKGNYSFKVSMNMAADVQPLNDTATYVTHVLGYPKIDFGAINDTLTVKLPYTLHAGPGNSGYLWQDNSTDSIFTITKDNYMSSNTLYSVIVTDVNACTNLKTVDVIESFNDLGIMGMNIPLDNCIISNSTKLNVNLKNNGSGKIANQTIELSYSINGGIVVKKQQTISLNKGATTLIEFDDPIDLSTIGNYNLALDLSYANDENLSNNTNAYTINVYGNPKVDFGTTKDTLKTSLPYNLDAGAGFDNYKWQDNSTNRYFNVTVDGLYKVLVTDSHSCSSKDSIYIMKSTGLKSLKGEAVISLYPNPVSDYLYVQIKLLKNTDLTMDLLSQDGKVIMVKKWENMDSYREDIDVSTLPKGLYYLRIYSKDSIAIEKVVVR
jgi:hypothetical protein